MNDSAALTSLIFLGRTLQFASGMLLVNVVVFRWLVLPPVSDEAGGVGRDLRHFLRWLDISFVVSGITLVLSGIALFLGAAAGMSGTPLSQILDRTLLSTVLFQTEFGHVCQVRCVIALLLAGATGWMAFHRLRSSTWAAAFRILAALFAAALFLSIAFTGHAAAVGHTGLPWPLFVDTTHLAFASIWPAGLLPFALFLRCLGDAYGTHLDFILTSVRRFSTVSLIAVGGLALTGVVNAWYLVGSPSQLLGSTYGHVLCLKLFVFVLMLGVAAWNRQVLLPRLVVHGNRADASAAAAAEESLRRFVLVEVCLAVLVVMIVSVLGVTPPPGLAP